MAANHEKLRTILGEMSRKKLLSETFTYEDLLTIAAETINATRSGQSFAVLRVLQVSCSSDADGFDEYRGKRDPRKYRKLKDVKNTWKYSLKPIKKEANKRRLCIEAEPRIESSMPQQSSAGNLIVPQYLRDNVDRIHNLGEQDLGRWKKSYDHPAFQQFEIMQSLRERFPNRRITRGNIVQLFRDGENYLGFFAAMVWGFINATRPRPNVAGDGRTATDLYQALMHPRDEVEGAIHHAVARFREQDYVTPFQTMLRDEMHKIPGVDYPYFTKMFFFVGQAFDEFINKKPLIFDRWTKNAFFALLSQSKPEEVRAYFSAVIDANNQNRPGEVRVRSGTKLIRGYSRFIELMNQWALAIGVAPDRLEQFVFGYDLRQGGVSTNPRMELWRIVDKNRILVKR